MATIDVASITQEFNNAFRSWMNTGSSYRQAIRSEGNIYSRLIADEALYDLPHNPMWITRYKVLNEIERRVMQHGR